MGSFEGLIYDTVNWTPSVVTGIFSSFVLTIDTPDDVYRQVLGAFIRVQTNATAGDRRFAFTADDLTAGSSFVRCPSGVTQPASTDYYYCFGIGVPDVSAVRSNIITVPIPPIVLPPDKRIRVLDLNAVAAVSNGDVLSGFFNVVDRRIAG